MSRIYKLKAFKIHKDGRFGIYIKSKSDILWQITCMLLTISIWQPMASKSAESWTIFNIAPAITTKQYFI